MSGDMLKISRIILISQILIDSQTWIFCYVHRAGAILNGSMIKNIFLRRTGLKYYSIIRGADSIDIKTEIPASFPAGVELSVTINQNNELLFTTKTNPETLALISDSNLLLSFSIRNEVFKTIAFKIKSPITSFVIPTDDLPDGILMVTLSTLEDLPLSERLIYIEREAPLKIQIETNKNIYRKREPVSLKISMKGDSTTGSE